LPEMKPFEPDPSILQHPNIPKPLHGTAPRVIKGKDWWDTQRQAAYAASDYCCAACGVHKSQAQYHKWLEAHEVYRFDYPNGRAYYLGAVALCHACHNFIHSGRMEMMVRRGEMADSKRQAILKHGKKVLMDGFRAGKVCPVQTPESIAQWQDWRLVLEGQEYPGRFRDYQDWQDHYASGGN
jgi:hypothetical protein